ncbi:MAG: UDP-glucose 4-epimerase GalE [Bacteriovoracaceae bacterium]|nr:UDP-glucose 4-epimerase GalE [Bacteriovoracaceae bacterium]
MQEVYGLITGGAGYIGSHVVKLLGESGYKTVTYDNLSTGNKDSVLYGEFVEGDLADLETLDGVFKKYKIGYVIHFAASIIVPESVEDPMKYYQNNTQNSANLINMCIKHNVNNFIFSSTAATYGLGDGNPDGVDEKCLPLPINPYGRSKLMTEWMLEDVANITPDFNYIALRYFNVSGADLDGKIGQMSEKSTLLINVALQTALGNREQLEIFGTDYDTPDGTCIRDYIHVVDLAQAHLDALKYLEKNPQSHILNCGYGRGASVKEVVKAVKELLKIDFKAVESPRRAGDPPVLISKAEKIGEVIGWKPKHDNLTKIIESAYNWQKAKN